MIGALTLAAATAALSLSSGDFIATGAMPAVLMAHDCGGDNHSPSLVWTGTPSGTKSFALLIVDPDAPIAGGFYHWVLYDIPATQTQLRGNAAQPAREVGIGSNGKAEYYGPCPPSGPAHHYIFTLYALDVEKLRGDAPLDAEKLLHRIQGHVLAKATLEATASTP